MKRIFTVGKTLSKDFLSSYLSTQKQISHSLASLSKTDKELYGFDWDELEVETREMIEFDDVIHDEDLVKNWESFQKELNGEISSVDDISNIILDNEINIMFAESDDVSEYFTEKEYEDQSTDDLYHAEDYYEDYYEEEPKTRVTLRKIFWYILVASVIHDMLKGKNRKKLKWRKFNKEKWKISNLFKYLKSHEKKVLIDPLYPNNHRPVLVIDVKDTLVRQEIVKKKYRFTLRKGGKQFVRLLSNHYDVVLYYNNGKQRESDAKQILNLLFNNMGKDDPRVHYKFDKDFPKGEDSLKNLLKNRKIERVLVYGGRDRFMNKNCIPAAKWKGSDRNLEYMAYFFVYCVEKLKKGETDLRNILNNFNCQNDLEVVKKIQPVIKRSREEEADRKSSGEIGKKTETNNPDEPEE